MLPKWIVAQAIQNKLASENISFFDQQRYPCHQFTLLLYIIFNRYVNQYILFKDLPFSKGEVLTILKATKVWQRGIFISFINFHPILFALFLAFVSFQDSCIF